jgi:transcriptional regulator with XRE-family HTH domain
MKKDFNIEIGKRIKEKRTSAGLTREKFAIMSRITDKFLYDVEVGNKGISAYTLHNIAKALDVSAGWLLSGEQ